MADPTPQSFRLAVGQAKTLVLTLDEAPTSSPAAWEMRFRMRDGRGNVLIEAESGDGITYTGFGSVYEWEVAIPEADTEDLKPGIRPWSFWDIDVGSANPLALGTCEVYATAETG